MSSDKYLPTFAEETFLAHCYGTDEEIEQFDILTSNLADRQNLVHLIVLTESIKTRKSLGMSWQCCWRCQRHARCEMNWVRGEKDLPRTCCPCCVNYKDCNSTYSTGQPGKGA